MDFSTAPGATITAQPAKGPPIPLGVADDKGKLRITQNLGDGTYTFAANKEDYTSAQLTDQKIELTKTYHFDLNLTAQPATIYLSTKQPGATVRIGSQVLGTTPLTTTKIPVDTTVKLTFELAGYQTVERTLRVGPGFTGNIDVGDLTARMGALSLDFKLAGHAPTALEQRDAKILVNQNPFPASTKQVPDMLEGSYQVTFTHPDYFPVDKNVTIEAGKTAAAAADLQPRPARLVIQPDPVVPVAVFLNNHPLPAKPDGSYELPPNQADTVRVEAQDYSNYERVFKPAPNEAMHLAVPLSRMQPPAAGQEYNVPYLNLVLEWIPPGNFTMGSPGSEIARRASEGPATQVQIPAGFWAGKYTVTQMQYQAVMGENPSAFGQNDPQQGNFPVERVSWSKAVEFTRRLTEREAAAHRLPAGYEFRLPTEAEWEYLARAGTTTAFWFGDHADPTNANFNGTYPTGSGSELIAQNSVSGTKPVGSYKPNPFHLYDVNGNVAQWVLDPYKSRLPGGAITAPATGAGDPNAKRFFRGGGWRDNATDARSAARPRDDGVPPDTATDNIGLRVILAPVITAKP